jgi:putative nucleotidyltransferase with HDIG domain
MIYRETDRPALAESRLLRAVNLAMDAGSVLGEAEAWREVALLYQKMGRNQDALGSLSSAHRLFRRLDARIDMVYVGGKVAELHGTYLAVVRAWGESIESSDSYTYGHCARVARNAVALARALGLDENGENTVLIGAYLHDVGMVRVPHEILHKNGPLTRDETEILEQHPVWGIELLASVEFPWDIKPIIRWHHEHYDGSGYPDRLKGDEIPLTAQIVGILDCYDALTTTPRTERPIGAEEALQRMTKYRSWWSDRVFTAFRQLLDLPGGLMQSP